ncbi:hypothetical protein N8482_00900 [Chitinophagales bacterium]|nr:hypothetical protein [Chitinophagales bacterium]
MDAGKLLVILIAVIVSTIVTGIYFRVNHINPAFNTNGSIVLYPITDWQYLGKTMKLLADCTAVLMLPWLYWQQKEMALILLTISLLMYLSAKYFTYISTGSRILIDDKKIEFCSRKGKSFTLKWEDLDYGYFHSLDGYFEIRSKDQKMRITKSTGGFYLFIEKMLNGTGWDPEEMNIPKWAYD